MMHGSMVDINTNVKSIVLHNPTLLKNKSVIINFDRRRHDRIRSCSKNDIFISK